ncbi:Pre-mRNA-splicing factor ISY1-like protein, partial [Mucuna pruriens]
MHEIEHYLHDLNNEITKLIHEKFHWECCIFKLGGPNLASTLPNNNIVDVPNPNDRDYHYFGIATKLSSVRELFQKSH